tara:strand:- start:399 stop:1283 length:885 start_codon:yes stop_codon:yes gene_type:complete
VIYLHTDALGSVVGESSGNGWVTKRYHYEPFGKENGSPALTSSQPGFTGHFYDAESGLNYMKARFYDPQIGRFYSPDPVSFIPDIPYSFNRYAYANNNPYKYIDPDGRLTVNIGSGLTFVPVLGFDLSGGVVFQFTDDVGNISFDMAFYHTAGPAIGVDIGVDFLQFGVQQGSIANSFRGSSGSITTDLMLPFISATGTITSGDINYGGQINLGISVADAIFFTTGIPVPEVVGSKNTTHIITVEDALNGFRTGVSTFFESFFGPVDGPNENGARYPIDSLDLDFGADGTGSDF